MLHFETYGRVRSFRNKPIARRRRPIRKRFVNTSRTTRGHLRRRREKISKDTATTSKVEQSATHRGKSTRRSAKRWLQRRWLTAVCRPEEIVFARQFWRRQPG